MSSAYAVTAEIELESYFGHWCIHIWTPHYASRINCAAETAGRELLEALSKHCLVDGFALDAEGDR